MRFAAHFAALPRDDTVAAALSQSRSWGSSGDHVDAGLQEQATLPHILSILEVWFASQVAHFQNQELLPVDPMVADEPQSHKRQFFPLCIVTSQVALLPHTLWCCSSPSTSCATCFLAPSSFMANHWSTAPQPILQCSTLQPTSVLPSIVAGVAHSILSPRRQRQALQRSLARVASTLWPLMLLGLSSHSSASQSLPLGPTDPAPPDPNRDPRRPPPLPQRRANDARELKQAQKNLC